MTETPLTDWATAFDRYRQASGALLAELDRVEGGDIDEIDGQISDVYTLAGMQLLYVPTRHVVHIAQKIRVANNVLYLDGMHPDLAQLLIDDLLALAGIEDGDAAPLPPKAR